MDKLISDLKESFKNLYVVTDDREKVELFVEIAIDLGYKRFSCLTDYMKEWDSVIISGNPSQIMGGGHNPIGKIEVTLHELLTLEKELSSITPRSHADIIKAHADGYSVEMLRQSNGEWIYTHNPQFLPDCTYRVKGFTELGKAAVTEARLKKTKEIDLARAALEQLEDELAYL